MQLVLPFLANAGAFELIRSQRRSLSLEVYPGGRVVVRAPLRLADHHIRAFVQNKWPWVEKKLQQQQQLAQPKPRFAPSEHFAYLGHFYALVLCEPHQPSYLNKDILFLAVRSQQASDIRQALLAWYKQQAQLVLPQRVAMYAQAVGRQPRRLNFRYNQRRWGSCNAQIASLNFNILLMMVPLVLIDYVVVHELCHLLEPNHSNRFWRKVAAIMPDYKTRQQALRQLEPRVLL